MAVPEREELWDVLKREYGPEAFIVYKPEGLEYYVVAGSAREGGFKPILEDVASRIGEVK
jgi:hypothetical protein